MKERGVQNASWVWRLFTYLILIFWAIVALFPVYWMVITSFKLPIDVSAGPKFFPFIDYKPSLDAWQLLFGRLRVQVMIPFTNSLVVGITSALLALVIGSMAGYGLSRFTYKLGPMKNNDIAFWFISQRMMPPVVLILPFLIMFRGLHLLDTQIGLIIAYTGFSLPFVVWITRDFFSQLPRDLEDSAMLDGYSRARVFMKIVLPLSTPGLLAAGLLALIFNWNEYLFALMLTFEKAVTMPIFIFGQNTSRGPEWWTMSAVAILTVLPVVIVGLALERFTSKGIILGSVK